MLLEDAVVSSRIGNIAHLAGLNRVTSPLGNTKHLMFGLRDSCSPSASELFMETSLGSSDFSSKQEGTANYMPVNR